MSTPRQRRRSTSCRGSTRSSMTPCARIPSQGARRRGRSRRSQTALRVQGAMWSWYQTGPACGTFWTMGSRCSRGSSTSGGSSSRGRATGRPVRRRPGPSSKRMVPTKAGAGEPCRRRTQPSGSSSWPVPPSGGTSACCAWCSSTRPGRACRPAQRKRRSTRYARRATPLPTRCPRSWPRRRRAICCRAS